MRNDLWTKGLVVVILLLFVGTVLIPSKGGIAKEKTIFTNLTPRGYIQGLIDNASDGDIIYIPSGIYYEDIIINKSISLIGEDKNTTIIDGNYSAGYVVWIVSDWVNISGFTITNASTWPISQGIRINTCHNTIYCNIISNTDIGIYVCNDSNTITDNTIEYNGYGIGFFGDNNSIAGNILINNWDGIHLYESSSNNIITDNNISSNNWSGIYLEKSDSNTITDNNILTNGIHGIFLSLSDNNSIYFNTIKVNNKGIYLENSSDNTILKNNFLNNKQDAFFNKSNKNTWNQNYWNRTRILPKFIFGTIQIRNIEIPWFNIDWRPALKLNVNDE